MVEENKKPFYEDLDTFPNEIVLTGCDLITINNCNGIRLVIDGYTLQCYENLDDGYRSSMNEMVLTYEPVKNMFLPCKLIKESIYVDFSGFKYKDVITNKTVLEIGTDYADSYYPMAVLHFNP